MSCRDARVGWGRGKKARVRVREGRARKGAARATSPPRGANDVQLLH